MWIREEWNKEPLAQDPERDEMRVVVITLSEYRELVSDSAVSGYKLEKKDEEIRSLKKKVEHLQATVSTLTNPREEPEDDE